MTIREFETKLKQLVRFYRFMPSEEATLQLETLNQAAKSQLARKTANELRNALAELNFLICMQNSPDPHEVLRAFRRYLKTNASPPYTIIVRSAEVMMMLSRRKLFTGARTIYLHRETILSRFTNQEEKERARAMLDLIWQGVLDMRTMY